MEMTAKALVVSCMLTVFAGCWHDRGSTYPPSVDAGQACAAGHASINPCAATLCPVDTECVIIETYPATAKCVPIDRCAAVRCAAGTHCDDGACIPDQTSVFCGGIAGFPCPGAGQCEDVAGDGCDPKHGGADCGGACTCDALAKCSADQVWNSSPTVCACVPADAPDSTMK